jgi:hypothetical protein
LIVIFAYQSPISGYKMKRIGIAILTVSWQDKINTFDDKSKA